MLTLIGLYSKYKLDNYIMLTYTVSISRYLTPIKHALKLKLLIIILKINYNNNKTLILVYNVAASFSPKKFVLTFDPSIFIFLFFSSISCKKYGNLKLKFKHVHFQRTYFGYFC